MNIEGSHPHIILISCFRIVQSLPVFPEKVNMGRNHTVNLSENITEEDILEDFEEFDLRDAINVGAYSVMSASKVLFSIF